MISVFWFKKLLLFFFMDIEHTQPNEICKGAKIQHKAKFKTELTHSQCTRQNIIKNTSYQTTKSNS